MSFLDRARSLLPGRYRAAYTSLENGEPGDTQLSRRSKLSQRAFQRWLGFFAAFCVLGLIGLAIFTVWGRPNAVFMPVNPALQVSLDPKTAARLKIDALYARQSDTLVQAISRYRLKTNRDPPLHYDKWFQFAREHSCLIDDYDQIYADFEPFYQLVKKDPNFFSNLVDFASRTAQEIGAGVKTAEVRDGAFNFTSWETTYFDADWTKHIHRFHKLLPDLNIILNGRDEPRVLFNYREAGAMDRAFNRTDTIPWEHSPSTSVVFKDGKKCLLPNQPAGFTSFANDASAFLIHSSSADYTTDLLPILSQTRISPCYADILVPSEYYYSDSNMATKYEYPDPIAWKDKKSQIYWRGSSSGGIIEANKSDYHNFPRFRAVDIARNHSDIMDVAISQFIDYQCDGCDAEAIKKEYNITFDTAHPREYGYGFKYVLDIDGNTFSGRYFGLLKSGSLVFKTTVFDEYFNDWLHPYEHYIPVLPDMADLVQKVQWAIANDEEAHRIQEAGRHFVEQVLTDAQNDCYLFAVFLEWANLQHYARSE